MWEYKIKRQFNIIYKIMQEVSELEMSVANPSEDRHDLIRVGLEIMDNHGWMRSKNVRQEGHLAYLLAKEFVNLYDYYHNWRHNTIGLDLLSFLTNCLECIESQKQYGVSREDDEQTYITGLNRLRKQYLIKKVKGEDTSEVESLTNTIFKGLRDTIFSLYSLNYDKAI